MEIEGVVAADDGSAIAGVFVVPPRSASALGSSFLPCVDTRRLGLKTLGKLGTDSCFPPRCDGLDGGPEPLGDFGTGSKSARCICLPRGDDRGAGLEALGDFGTSSSLTRGDRGPGYETPGNLGTGSDDDGRGARFSEALGGFGVGSLLSQLGVCGAGPGLLGEFGTGSEFAQCLCFPRGDNRVA